MVPELTTPARRGPWEGWELMTTETAADGVLLFLRRPSSDAEGVVSGA